MEEEEQREEEEEESASLKIYAEKFHVPNLHSDKIFPSFRQNEERGKTGTFSLDYGFALSMAKDRKGLRTFAF